MTGRSPKNLIFVLLPILLVILFINDCVSAQNRRGRLREFLRERRENSGNRDANLQEIKVGGANRTYLLHLPKNYRKDKKLPLVIAFHGGGGNAQNMENMSGFSQKADAENFIVVYPNGSNGQTKNIFLTWNAVGCCSYASENNIDDVGFVRALIDKLSNEYAVDTKRIYATGFSNGAMLSFRLGTELADKLAAIAPVSGAIFDSTKTRGGKIPVLMIHGAKDTAVKYDGGISDRGIVKKAQTEEYKSVRYAAEFWAKNNGCRLHSDKTQDGNVIKETFQSCAANNDVILYTITDGTHAWAGGKRGRDSGDAPSNSIAATDTIWEFFKAHTKK